MNPQSGITTRPPEHLILAGLTFTSSDTIGNRTSLTGLQTLIERELHSDLDDLTSATDRAVPSAETGELGVADHFNRAHLTVTIGISFTGCTALGIAGDDVPSDLIVIPWTEWGDTPPATASGDLIVQICSDDPYVTEHALRRIEHTLAGALTTTWALVGVQRFTSRAGRTSQSEGRALIGFHDGLVNLDPRHNPDDAALVFIDPAAVGTYPPSPSPGPQPAPAQGQPGYGGPGGPVFPTLRQPPTTVPAWTSGGTYMTVRASVTDTARWDATALGEQERAVGRWKPSGATLDHQDDPAQIHTEPDFASDPTGAKVPLIAHIRKANPRTGPTDASRRIFRRGYPLIAAGAVGKLQRGLIFISFSRTLSTQPEFILKAWLRNPDFPVPGAGLDPLLQFDTSVLAGGYYFIPAVSGPREPWTWVLPYGATP